MEALASTYRGLITTDKIIFNVIKLSEVAQMARTERRLRDFMIAAWNRRKKQAAKAAGEATRKAKTADQALKDVNKVVEDIMMKWPLDVTKTFREEFNQLYELGRIAAWKKATRQTKAPLGYDFPSVEKPVKKAAGDVVYALEPSFDLVDDYAMNSLGAKQTFWIGKHYNMGISFAINEEASKIIEKGFGTVQAGKEMQSMINTALSKVSFPAGFRGTDKQYVEALVGNAAAVARNHGQVRSFADIGITTYQITAVGDKRTCARCSHMDGKVFTTKQGIRQAESEIQAITPDEIKKIHPWLSMNQLEKISPKAGHQSAKDSSNLSKAGLALPPYHFKCRCSIDISTKSETYENLSPLPPPAMPTKQSKVPVVTPKGKPVEGRHKRNDVWLKSLNDSEKRAISSWTGDFYSDVRAFERGAMPEFVDNVSAYTRYRYLNKALSTAPYYKGTVYRGLSDIPLSALPEMTEVGSVFELNAKSSFSKLKRKAKVFAHGFDKKHKFVILKAKVSKKSYDVENLSSYRSEREVIVEKGEQFKVKKVKEIYKDHSYYTAEGWKSEEMLAGYEVELEQII